ncbi:MAG: PepSY domain-containing protein [Oscillospiraceae bacterium]
MKRKTFICALGLAVLLLGGCAQQQNPAAYIGTEEAKAQALAHAGLTGEQVTFSKAKLDNENGRQIYEVEFYTGDGREYEYEIDASAGTVLRYHYDEKQAASSSSGETAITEAQARELALSRVPGAAESDILEFKTEHDNGRTEYEGKIVYGGTEYEFEIDGDSGTLLSWEAEPVNG